VLPAALLALAMGAFWRADVSAHIWARVGSGGLGMLGSGPWGITPLLLQGYAFLGAGLWLVWRMIDKESWLAREFVAGRRRWSLLLLLVVWIAAMAFGPESGTRVAVAAVLAMIALLLAGLLPTVAADLAAVGLVAFGIYGMAMIPLWPGHIGVPGDNQDVMFGAVLVGDRQTAVLAGLQGLVLLGFGLWLVPRTLGSRPQPDPALAGRVNRLQQTRADAVDTAAAELRRVERDLHDGAQARLVGLGMSLRAAERMMKTSPDAALELVAEARETSAKALTELRDLVRGIYPPVLADRGLADAVRALALDAPLPTETEIDLDGRPDAPVESACYFAVAEALANAVKHSGASRVHIGIRHSGGMLRIEVTDDGCGGADLAGGTGLAGVEKRLGTFDGILAVSSPPGGPTMIVMEVPCALSSPRTSTC
jgi:signal transduction histidine kinase